MNEAFRYEKAPPGSPDRFRLTDDTHFRWTGCPRRFWDLAARRGVRTDTGYVVAYVKDGRRVLHACVFKGFYFAVSVAPSFRRSLPAACLHDWLYANSEKLSSAWGCTRRETLRLADHWFLALMRFTGFFLKRTYFIFVRLCGHAFNTLFGKTHS